MSNLQKPLPTSLIPAGTRLSVKIGEAFASVMTKYESYILEEGHFVHVFGFGIDEVIPVTSIVDLQKVKGWRHVQMDSPNLFAKLVDQLEVMTVLAKEHCSEQLEAIQQSEALIKKAKKEKSYENGDC